MLDAFKKLHTPCYVIDEDAIEANCKKLQSVIEKAGCKILLAQKAFSNFTYYPLISKYLSGTEASGLFEARLGREEMPNKEVHVFCGAYKDEDFDELLEYADHIVFNSVKFLLYQARSPVTYQSFGVIPGNCFISCIAFSLKTKS